MIPEIGQYVMFPNGFIFMGGDGAFGTFIDLNKGAVALIVDKCWTRTSDTADEMNLNLILSVKTHKEERFFRLNYGIHKETTRIINDTKAAKVLYSNETE